MKLPNPHKAVVEIRKLRDYSLNVDHSVGKHKARVFKASLGLTLQQADWLRNRALELAITGEAGKRIAVSIWRHVCNRCVDHLQRQDDVGQVLLDCRIRDGLSTPD